MLTAFVVPALLMLAATISMGALVTRSASALSANVRITQDAVTGNGRTLSQTQRELLRLVQALSVPAPVADDVELHRALAAQRVQESTLAYQERTLGTHEQFLQAHELAAAWTTAIEPQVARYVAAPDRWNPAEMAALVAQTSTLELGYNQLVSDAEISRKVQAGEANATTRQLVSGTRWMIVGLVLTLLAFVALVASTVRFLLRARRAQMRAASALDRTRAQLQRHSMVVQTTDNFVVITDDHGRIDWVNAAFTRRTGYELADVVGRVPGDLLQGPGTDPGTVAFMRERLTAHEGFTCEILNYARDETPYWVSLEVRPITDPDGTVTGFVAVQGDITERRATNAALLAAKDSAEEVARDKAHFLASMSHEIRTPLNAVLGLTELLLDTSLDTSQRDFVETAHRSGRLLLALVNEILDFSALDSGQVELESAPVRISALIGDVEQMLAPSARRAGLVLTHEIAADVPDLVLGDATRLQQVLVNLVGNGLKFTSAGGVHIAVSRTPGADGASDQLNLAVTDTGIGIPVGRQERIFRAFTQVDTSTTRVYGGTGLGLTICELVATQMHGHLELRSAPGEGSTFTLVIPMTPCAADAAAVEGPSAGVLSAERAAGLAVLLVEDDVVNSMVALHMLRRLGIDADVAVDGHAAVAAASARDYDVIFMDVHMPGMDGLEATAEIRSTGGRRPWIVALTANALDGDRERMLAAGMDDYVSKPVQLVELSTALQRSTPNLPARVPAAH